MVGDSTGGYLSEMMAAVNGEQGWEHGESLQYSSDIQSAVSFYGISDLTCIGEGLGQERESVHLSPAVTEALLVHGPAFDTFP